MPVLIAESVFLQNTGKVQWVRPGELGPGIEINSGVRKYIEKIGKTRRVMPIEVTETGFIVDGEHRYRAMIELGVFRIPVFVGEQQGSIGRLVRPYPGIRVPVDIRESLFDQAMSPMGNCYEVAAKAIMDEAMAAGFQSGKLVDFEAVKMILVHAEIQGDLPFRYGHGWIERDGKCIDDSNGNHIEMPRVAFYKRVGVIDKPGKIYRYTAPEVKRWLQKTKQYGPWELETESGY